MFTFDNGKWYDNCKCPICGHDYLVAPGGNSDCPKCKPTKKVNGDD